MFSFSYYLFCIGSRSQGNLRLGIRARMHETTLTEGTSSFVLNEIERIDINTTVVPEQQVIRTKSFFLEFDKIH